MGTTFKGMRNDVHKGNYGCAISDTTVKLHGISLQKQAEHPSPLFT